MQLWLNGGIIEEDKARISPTDRGFLLSDGVFDTALAINGEIFRQGVHIGRLRHDADILGINIPYTDQELKDAVTECLAANDLTRGLAAVRTTVTRGSGDRGLLPPDYPSPTILISATAYAPPDTPATAILASTRRNENSVTSRIKSLEYLDNIIARQEAAWAGADDAIMLNNQGHVACSTVGNIFMVVRGTLLTPGIDDGILPGVMRLTVFDLMEELNLSVEETALSPEDLETADEAFLTNSLIGIRPLVTFGEKQIGDGTPGDITTRLQKSLTGVLTRP